MTAEDAGDGAIEIDGDAKACRALAVTFSSTVTLSKLDVIGSGAEEPVDWPRLVVTSAPEHFGKLAWVAGFVARPRAMAGAIRTAVAGRASEAMTGDFGQLVQRDKPDGAWTVDVSAQYPDGTQQTQSIVLAADRTAALPANQAATANNPTTPNDKRFGKVGDVAVGQVTSIAGTRVPLGTLVGLDIPPGAVDRPTTIKAQHLDQSGIPPLDPGMINVTAPKGHGYEFLPHGQHFNKDIAVVVPFDASLIPQGMSINDVNTYYFDTTERRWKKLPRAAIDLGDHTLRSTTNHFTIMINAVLATPSNPKPLAFDPTALSSVAVASPAANIDFIAPPTPSSTGDARMSLPIRLPAGRGAYTPSAGLVYSSASGNGWLGVGWDLPSSKIEIDTRWGVPSYAETDEPRYLIDGAEMVPTLDTDGPACPNGKRYHLRIEGAFTHILRCGAWPNYYWELRDRNGTLFTYGGTPTSVLQSYRDPYGIYRWNLREVTDVHGNKSTYSYFVDEIAAGANGSEASRETYLDAIDYTEHPSSSAKYHVALIRDDGTRPDKVVNGRPGFKVVTRHLLRAIRVEFNPGGGAQVVREYVLTYKPGQFGKTVLDTVKLYGAGGCTPALGAFTPPACNGAAFFNQHSFTYFDETDGLAGFGAPTTWAMVDDPDPTHASITKGDSMMNSGSVSLGMSGSGGSWSAGVSSTNGDRWELIGLYDVNGDGLVDQLMDTGTGLVVL